MIRTNLKYLTISFELAALLLVGCGGSSDDDAIRGAIVTDVRVDPDSVRLGDDIKIQVDFNPTEFLGSSTSSSSIEASTVVVRLPPGVDYVTGSSQFDGSDVGGFRDRGPNHVELCEDGTRVLTYQFTSGEQTDNENKIKLVARAYEGSGTVYFDAEANDDIFDSCRIRGDDYDTLEIF